MQQNLKHVAIIMDGNARWAECNSKTQSEGHKVGAENAKKVLQYALECRVQYLTLYAFSSENWQRPAHEVSMLIKLLQYYISQDIQLLHEKQICFKVIGDHSKLPAKLVNKIHKIEEETKHYAKINVTIAFSYGARAEITNACQKIIDSGIHNITEELFKKFLYDDTMPDVDILIRTGGFHRISNFLLWQISYAELYFLDKLWPDFSKEDFTKIIVDYSSTVRNFGAR